MSIKNKLLCIPVILFFSGCGMGIFGPVKAYEGSARSSQETALVEVSPYTLGSPPTDNFGKIEDIAVDGVSYSNFLQDDDKRDKQYSILAGTRKVQVKYHRGLSICSIGPNPNFFLGTSSSATRETCSNQNVKEYTCVISFEANPSNHYEIQITSDFNNMRGGDPSVTIETVLKSAPDSPIKTGRCSRS